MKKLYALLVVFLMIAATAGMTACSSSGGVGENLIDNSEFSASSAESSVVPDGWKHVVHQQIASDSVSTDLRESGSGNVFEIYHSSRAYSALSQAVAVSKNTTYQFSFEFKILDTPLSDFGLNSGVLQDESFVGAKMIAVTGANFGVSTVYVNSGNNTTLTLAIRLGVPYIASKDIAESLCQGRVEIRNPALRRMTPAPSVEVFTLGSETQNKVANYDFAMRNADGTLVMAEDAGYVFAADNNMPSGWTFNSDLDKSSVKVGKWVKEGLSFNYAQMTLTGDRSSLTQKLKLKSNTYYQLSYYYCIPSNDYLYSEGDPEYYSKGGMLFPVNNSGYNTYAGLHAAVLQDPMYVGSGKDSINTGVTTDSNTLSAPWRHYSEVINSNYVSNVDFGIRVGDLQAPVIGVVRFSNICVKEIVPTVSQVENAHFLVRYNGDGSNKNQGLWLYFVLLAITIAVCVVAAWLINQSFRQNKQDKKDKSESALKTDEDSSLKSETVSTEQTADSAGDVAPLESAENADTLIAEDTAVKNTKPKIAKKKTLAAKITGLLTARPELTLLLIAGIGIIIRIVFAITIRGSRPDINQYINIIGLLSSDRANAITESGYLNPPLYLYFLELVRLLTGLFNLNPTNVWYIFILKLPAIISDILIGVMIYIIAKKYSNVKLALVLSALVIFNPAVMLYSSVWGEFDSVAILLAVVAVYFLLEKKYLLMCVFYTLSALTKTSMHLLAIPLLVYIITTMITSFQNLSAARSQNKPAIAVLKSDNVSPVWKFPLYGIICIALIYLLSALYVSENLETNFFYPLTKFFFENALSQHFFSNNALNLFALLGRNYTLFESSYVSLIMTILFAALLTVLSVMLYMRRRNRANLVLICALSVALIFCFMVNMNPRYNLILLPLLLISFVASKDRRLIVVFTLYSILIFSGGMFVLLSAVNLNNLPDSLLNYATNAKYAGVAGIDSLPVLVIFSLFNIILMLYFAFIVFEIVINNRRQPVVPAYGKNTFLASLKNYVLPQKMIKNSKTTESKK